MGLSWASRNNIISCIGKVAKAKEECDIARKTIAPIQQQVGECWNSESGAAMMEALEQVRRQIDNAYGELCSAESAVRSQGYFIINNYVEDTDE